jgi:hypothetical protein
VNLLLSIFASDILPIFVIAGIGFLLFEISPAFVTSAVFVSTILSPLTLTPLIAYL